MSVDAFAWALLQRVKPSSAKFVLAVCGSHSNPERLCWPSVSLLAEETGQDRKTVLESLRRLRESGHLEDTGERRGATKQVIVYRLNIPNNGTTPTRESIGTAIPSSTRSGAAAEEQTVPNFPSKSAEFPPEQSRFCRGTVPNSPIDGTENGTRNHQEPSGTVKETSGKKARARAPVVDVTPPHWMPKEPWEAWLEVRRKKNKWPTQYAIDKTLKDMEKWRAAGHDLTQILDYSIKCDYTGLFEPKYLPRKAAPEKSHVPRPAVEAA